MAEAINLAIFIGLFLLGMIIAEVISAVIKREKKKERQLNALRRNNRALENELRFYKSLVAGRDDFFGRAEEKTA